MAGTKLSAILKPVNITRRICGFETFDGFPEISEKNRSASILRVKKGDLAANVFDELNELIAAHDDTRYLGRIQKVNLIRGDATKTIPAFVDEHPHLVVSLLVLVLICMS